MCEFWGCGIVLLPAMQGQAMLGKQVFAVQRAGAVPCQRSHRNIAADRLVQTDPRKYSVIYN